MSVIKVKNISKSFGSNLLFKDVSFEINEYDKVGLVGENGSGKSTLLKLLSGEIEVDSGTIVIGKGMSIGYLKQATDYSLSDLINISSDKHTISEFLKTIKSLNITDDIEFTKERLDSLSGGEKTKIALSLILSKKPNILLLDEPTNHVDIDSINWLIDTLNEYNGTILIASHDRYFLNKTVGRIIEVSNNLVNVYQGNYDKYKMIKEKDMETLKEKYLEQEKLDKKITHEINKLKDWSLKGERKSGRQGGSMSDAKVKGVKTNAQRKAQKLSKAASNKMSRLEQLRQDKIEKPKEELVVKFNFNGNKSGTKTLIRIENVCKTFNNRTIFSNVNLTVLSNDKIGLVGSNGCGKTTLLKIIMDKLNSDSGNIWKTPSVKIAYMSQDVFDLENDKTIFEMGNQYDSVKKTYFFTNLVNMGFNREEFNKNISSLSLGQRMRIKLVQIILNDYNLLILDEPTNHLDLPNKIELENALIKFPGAIIIASHDKYLLSKVTNKLFLFKDNQIIKKDFGYQELLDNENNKDNNLKEQNNG